MKKDAETGKSYAAVCLEGAVIVLACIIFSLFASSPPVVNPDAAAVTMVWSYIGEAEYEIIAVFKTVAYSAEGYRYYDFVDAEKEEEFNAYVGKCKELALYDTGVTAEYGDRLITLSTCEYSAPNGRLVVVAKKAN